MPPTNTPQINFNIITFSFSIFRGFQGFSLTSCRRTDKQETCMAIQRRCLLVLCILLLLSHGSGHQKIYLPKRQMLFYSFSSQIPQVSHKYSHSVHRTFSSVAMHSSLTGQYFWQLSHCSVQSSSDTFSAIIPSNSFCSFIPAQLLHIHPELRYQVLHKLSDYTSLLHLVQSRFS